VISALFGASKITDIFNIGLMISNLMRRIVAENALENAFLPIFSRLFLRKSRKRSWEAASSIVNFNLILSLILAGLGIIFTPFILNTFFAEKLSDMGMLQETITMTRIMFPYLLLVTFSAVLATYLKAFNRFCIAEFSASFFSVGIIVMILIFHKSMGIYSLGWGVLLGGFFQLLFLFPFILNLKKNKSIGFTYKPVLRLMSPINKKYYRQLAPISLDVILAKISDVVPQILALSLMIEGAVSFLFYAIHIFRLPFSFISQAINSVILKEFSQNVALFEKDKAKKLFEDGVKINVFLLLPVSILMLILAEPLVTIIFKRGMFSQEDVMNTALALKFFSVGLIGWGIHAFSTRIFSARIDIKTSMFLNFFMIISHISLCLILVKTELTFAGLALASSISYLIFAMLRIIVLIRKLRGEAVLISIREIWLNLSKTFVSGVFMLAVMLLSIDVFSKLQFESDFLKNTFILISLSFVGVSVYLLSSLMFKNADVLFFQTKLRGNGKSIPVYMQSPFSFYAKVSQEPEKYSDKYSYKVNIFLSSRNWEIRNVGIKLIGLFKDTEKAGYLIDLLNSKQKNGFIKRNAINSLKALAVWKPEIKILVMKMIKDSYYEVRIAAINLLKSVAPIAELHDFSGILQKIVKRGMIEEKIAVLKLIGKKGAKSELEYCDQYLLSNNSILRETILEVLLDFYKREIISGGEIKVYLSRVLITSNNLVPRFKIKTIIARIYKEIE
jgi:putative peptidoglycan lipid II flippase